MVVMVPREKWTDDRLDDLNKKVDDGFARLEKKTDDGFARVDCEMKELRGEMNLRFHAVDARFDTLQRSLFAATVVIVGAMIGANAF